MFLDSAPAPWKPDLCIYHGGCPDGFTAAWVINHRYGYDVDFFAAKYGEEPPDVTGKRVIMVDFSYKRPVLTEMLKTAKEIIILDHHLSAQKDLEGLADEEHNAFIEIVFDMDRSGAGIAWDYCFPDRGRPLLVSYVEDRDLWKFKYEATEPFCAWLDLQMREFLVYDKIAFQSLTERYEAVNIGQYLVQKFNKDADSIIKSGTRWLVIDDVVVPVVNCPYMYASRIGNVLANLPAANFAATFFVDRSGNHNYSLRSVDSKMDVSVIAEKFGGGGHRNASGFRINPNIFDFEQVTPDVEAR